MTDDPHADRAVALVSDPERYDELAAQYSDEQVFYSKLRNSAQRAFDSFDGDLELRRIFLDRGPSEAVRERLAERLDRSLKNMLLRSSPRGEAFPVETLREANDRLDAFADLGVDTPSLLAVVKTTLEHVFDGDGIESPLTVLDRLLRDCPESQHEARQYAAWARLGEAIDSSETPARDAEEAVRDYCTVVDDPAAADERPAAELVAAARETPFVDDQKERLYATALHREQFPVRTPFDYLYVVAHEVVEAYRHGSDELRRADALIARRQLDILSELSVPGWSDERAARARSYYHVADAIQCGGGQWFSDRAGGPDPDWASVSVAYGSAAAELQSIDAIRATKYLSKAFRHGAHAVEEWKPRQVIHRAAKQVFRSVDTDADTRLAEALDGTVQTHRCREAEAGAHVAFEAGNYEDAVDAAREAQRLAGTVPQDSFHLDGIAFVEAFAAARRAEQRGDFEQAGRQYHQLTDQSEDARRRRALVRVKRELARGDYVAALKEAEIQFDEGSVLLAATRAAAGVVPDERAGGAGEIDLPHAGDATAALAPLLRVYSVEAVGGATLRERIERLLLRL